jgi:hypothetical protein
MMDVSSAKVATIVPNVMPPMQKNFYPLILFGLLNSVMFDNENGFVLLYNMLETINNLT